MNSKHSKIDPDYEITETVKEQIKMREETEMHNTLDRIRSIINREFKKELEFRENQLELIQQRLNKAAKTLHLLRYCLVTSYYNSNELQFNPTQEELLNMDGQSRIHPAVKKLLGNNAGPLDIRRQKTRKRHFNTIIQEQHNYKDDSTQEEVDTNSSESTSTDIMKTMSDSLSDITDTVRNRKIVNQCLVIGNISKWAPSESSEDNSTHKWMMYVRGPKELPDISHIVQKVVFYLHPSYKPNDVVEITQSPFHLSRRGWGEFPLRVQLYFHCKLNKPVDIIHNLKLDRTYTGRQTLGNETVIKLSLYDNGSHVDQQYNLPKECPSTNTYIEKLDENKIKENEYYIEKCDETSTPDNLQQISQENVSLKDNETCKEKNEISSYDDIKKVVELDHSYCRRNSHGASTEKSCTNVTINQVQLQQIIKNLSRFPNVDRVLINDKKVLLIKKRKQLQQSLLKTSLNKKIKLDNNIEESINYNKYKIDFPSCKFRCVSEALPFLFKRLCLINELSEDLDYKCLYPFTAKSIDEFSSWNVAKRFASEWARARSVHQFLLSSNMCGVNNWTTKKLVFYARAHGYTPLCNYNIFNKHVGQEHHFTDDCVCENPIKSTGSNISFEIDDPIDVEDCDIENENKKPLISFTDKNLDLECSYIKQTALDVGVLLKHEQIIPDILFNCTERILLQSALCLAENLIRNAQSLLVNKGFFSEETSTISVDDIIQVLKKRNDFNKILSFNKDKIKY